ncbi:DUF2341 domain-containing protein [bacterium]|nr:DUF2341 domain-containing protein [bacterium]
MILLAMLGNLGTSRAAVWQMYEAEDFQSYGGWSVGFESEAYNSTYLVVMPVSNPPVDDASTVISLPETSIYNVWVRAKDYPEYQPGARLFRAVVDGVETAQAGDHGTVSGEHWYWQKVAEISLDAGEHLLQLRDVNNYLGRCDAVLLTDDSRDPNIFSRGTLYSKRTDPIWARIPLPEAYEGTYPLPLGPVVATLQNEHLKIDFHEEVGGPMGTRLIRETSLYDGSGWTSAPEVSTSDTLVLLRTDVTTVSFRQQAYWQPQIISVPVTIQGQDIVFHNDPGDPFMAGVPEELFPVAARQLDGQTVEVDYVTTSGQTALGHWGLAPGSQDLLCSFTVVPSVTAYYSIGMMTGKGWTPDEVRALEMPPLLQLQRLPKRPFMLVDEIMPQPIALLEVGLDSLGGESVTLATVVDAGTLDFHWANARKAAYGFCLRDPRQGARPAIFSPVLGLEGSRWTAGQPQKVSWRIVVVVGDWKEGMEYISEHIMGVTDYRKPTLVSLTDAALNMFDLIDDDVASGWSDELKGFWDIETKAMSKQAAPLVVVSEAMLAQDEDLFRRRALPTIAYTLTRKLGWIVRPEDQATLDAYRLTVPSQYYGTAHWIGVHQMLNGLNPWLEEFYLPGGQVSYGLFGRALDWVEEFEMYRFRPDPVLLNQIVQKATDFVNTQVFGRQTEPVFYNNFYNYGFYPYWFDLVDLYDVTENQIFLDAAEEGAFNTMAGMWSHPMHPSGDVTIHPGGEVMAVTHLWWKDDVPFRLGFPLQPGDVVEKQVPAWWVSRVGLGLEGPGTYFQGEARMANITNAGWCNDLLRVFGRTGRDIFRTYARNAIIGRFANYPGYYIMDYSDIPLQPDFPYAGPDIASIYYHHIPVTLMFTLDFLFTEASVRSGGQIDFPWYKQKNYVWFTDRIYGTQPGVIYGETGAVPWINRDLVQLDTIDVDWIAARSGDRFFLVLMSQSDSPITANITLNSSLIGLTGEVWRRYEGASPTPVDQPVGIPAQVDVPAKGIVVLSLPAEEQEIFPKRPPLQNGHLVQAAGDWGDAHAFRIRSPFGSDGLYVALTGGPVAGTTVTLTMTGYGQTLEDGHYPYEFLIYPWPFHQSMDFQLNVPASGATPQQTVSLSIPGILPMEAISARSVSVGKIEIFFDQEIDPTSAGDPDRYRLDNNVTILGVTVNPAGRSVTLIVSPSLDRTTSYHVSVEGVQDFYGFAMDPGSIDVLVGAWAWDMAKNVVFNAEGLASDLVDFPALVVLDPVNFNYSEFQAGGADLCFQDRDGNDLPFEIEKWDTSGQSSVWVKVPSIPAGSTNAYVTMFWGYPLSWTGNDPTQVWSSYYSGVWHLASPVDSSPYGNDGTANAPVLTAAVIGDGLTFDGDDDIVVPDSDSLDFSGGPFTVSAWISKNSLSTMIPVSKDFGGIANKWSLGFGSNQIAFRANDIYCYTAPDSLMAQTWHYVTFVRDGNTGHTYVDGQPSDGPHDVSGFGSLTNAESLRIGSRIYQSEPGYYFNGKIDEVRVARAPRSAAWVRACYLNQKANSDFVRFEEPSSPRLSVEHWMEY